MEETAFASTGRLSAEEKERFNTLSEAERWKGALIFSRSAYMNEARLYITRQAGKSQCCISNKTGWKFPVADGCATTRALKLEISSIPSWPRRCSGSMGCR